jgi:hypothetical protein
MNAKVLTSLVLVAGLCIFAYAQEGTNCHVTIQAPCYAAGNQGGTCPNGQPVGTFWLAGQNQDTCVTSYGVMGGNGCGTEDQIQCSMSEKTFSADCSGTVIDTSPLVIKTTPTYADGPCQ